MRDLSAKKTGVIPSKGEGSRVPTQERRRAPTAFSALEDCTFFMAIGTSGVVEPAASFVRRVSGRARTVYAGPEEPANRRSFTEVCIGNSGELLPTLFEVVKLR